MRTWTDPGKDFPCRGGYLCFDGFQKEGKIAFLEFLIGALIVAAALYDVFQSVVVPRWTSRTLRLSPFLIEALWTVWCRAGRRVQTPQRREDFLGTFAPLAVMLLLLAWV